MSTTEAESLSTSVQPPSSSAVTPKTSYTYYHAGPLFTLADLNTNSLLSRAIHFHSQQKYNPIVPQDLEQRDTSPHSIRDQDIRALLSADLALFVYDGTELDSGTVIEFMIAKMADIPAVILRTDFRGAGDQAPDAATGKKGDPWNLMSSFYPRTETVVVDSMLTYKVGLNLGLQRAIKASDATTLAGTHIIEVTAEKVVQAFDRVVQIPAALPKELRESVYQWLAIMPGLRDGGPQNVADMLKLCSDKTAKGLL